MVERAGSGRAEPLPGDSRPVPRKVTVPANRTLLRYQRVAPDLRPYVDTWDELDLPLKAYFPLDEQPDRGLIPEVVVPESVDDVVRGVDAPLEAVRRLIAAAAADRAPNPLPTPDGPAAAASPAPRRRHCKPPRVEPRRARRTLRAGWPAATLTVRSARSPGG